MLEFSETLRRNLCVVSYGGIGSLGGMDAKCEQAFLRRLPYPLKPALRQEPIDFQGVPGAASSTLGHPFIM